MEIKIIKDKISLDEITKMAETQHGGMVKAVVDLEKEIMAVGGELHSDANELIIKEEDSNQENVWGINIFPEKNKEEWIEFVSLINIRPKANNFDMKIESEEIKKKIRVIVNNLIA